MLTARCNAGPCTTLRTIRAPASSSVAVMADCPDHASGDISGGDSVLAVWGCTAGILRTGSDGAGGVPRMTEAAGGCHACAIACSAGGRDTAATRNGSSALGSGRFR